MEFVAPELHEVTRGLAFPEGPIACSDGSVIVVEIAGGTLTRVRPDGSHETVAETGGGPNGAAIGPDGAIYVCDNGGFTWHTRQDGTVYPGHQPEDYSGGKILRVDPHSGATSTLYDGLRGPNDIVFAADGTFWFTDLGKRRPRDIDLGGLYHASIDGRSVTEVVHPLITPNGVGLSPGGERIYVAETATGRVWCWAVTGPGTLAAPDLPGPPGPGDARLLHGFSGYRNLDSMAVDGDGNVCVATLISGEISVLSPDGELLAAVRPPEHDPHVTNICFAGAGSREAWVTSSGWGRLYRCTWPVDGLDLAFSR